MTSFKRFDDGTPAAEWRLERVPPLPVPYPGDRVVVLAAHPGRLAHDIPIDLPSDRTPAARESIAFDRLAAKVSRTLREVQRQ